MFCLAFLKLTLFWISWFSESETKHRHSTFPRMSATKELCDDGKLKRLHLDTFLHPKSKQQKQSHREKQMASELSLLIWWLMWAQLVYLQKSNFPYVSSSNIVYYVYIIYAVHTSTYTQHKGIGCLPSNCGLSHNHKGHTWPFPGPGI